ncbi:MAG TPA: sulfotransferase [Candidatus Limnocylindria bacterium]|nr:sulfotransferase [Candidatus Limnocylindria bacterium]
MSERKPNFFQVGAMKAGTTSMHTYLAQHPDIYMSPRKEPRWSSFVPDLDSGNEADGRYFTRDRDEYLDHFRGAASEKVVGESSHVYLPSTEAARLIHEFAPDARILIMLRDPVTSIHSRHQQNVWMGREDILDFASALAAESDRRAGRRLPPDTPYYTGLRYRESCTMTPQVQRYVDVFGRDRVHMALLEDLGSKPLETYRGVLEFLGVDPDFVPAEMAVVNPGSGLRSVKLHQLRSRVAPIEKGVRRVMPQSLFRVLSAPLRAIWSANKRPAPRSPMAPELEEELTRYFAPDVASLSELVGRDLSQAWPRFQRPEVAGE